MVRPLENDLTIIISETHMPYAFAFNAFYWFNPSLRTNTLVPLYLKIVEGSIQLSCSNKCNKYKSSSPFVSRLKSSILGFRYRAYIDKITNKVFRKKVMCPLLCVFICVFFISQYICRGGLFCELYDLCKLCEAI